MARGILVLLLLGGVVAPTVGSSASPAPAAPDRPAYFRPAVVGGKAFPLARSNFLSLVNILSNWHAPRLRLVAGIWRLVGVHEGIDIAAERGTPVVAAEAGTVRNVGWTFYSGTRVGIQGTDGRYYLYAHLSAVDPRIHPGIGVAAGASVGLVGNTGYGPPGHRDEFPPHLHFGIMLGGGWINPYPLLISTYRWAVAADRRWQLTLDRLASSGQKALWARTAARVYLRGPPGQGE
jgi:murein DD-endopeptidase MepM/ murein hydrolase activator NlpD